MSIGKITNLFTSNSNKGKVRRILSDSLHLFNDDEIHKHVFKQGPKVKELPLPIFNKRKREDKVFDTQKTRSGCTASYRSLALELCGSAAEQSVHPLSCVL
jgi:hypothetical protein